MVPTIAKTVTVPFGKECNTQMATICQPAHGYEYHRCGHNYCKEVAQETYYNVPVVIEDIQDSKLPSPSPLRSASRSQMT